MRLRRMIGLLWILCLLSTVSCGRAIVSSADNTVQCKADCAFVSKALIKEHAELFDEVIRLREALAICEKRR